MESTHQKISTMQGIQAETLGQRIARLRKEKGYTQTELAGRMDTIQKLISDYERDNLRPHPEMIARFAKALSVTADELLGVTAMTGGENTPNLKIMRRMKIINELPSAKQKTVLKTIDLILEAAQK
jgi:transcriptional regulator with XRE-family HTH domain